jgi:hypothetical protein
MKQANQRSKNALEIFRAVVLGITVAAPIMFAASAYAEPATAPEGHPVTVVTLYSEMRPAPGALIAPKPAKPTRPPIQIVDGGVKSADGSCWTLSDSGQLTPVAGDCYVLRSAQPGERPTAAYGQMPR